MVDGSLNLDQLANAMVVAYRIRRLRLLDAIIGLFNFLQRRINIIIIISILLKFTLFLNTDTRRTYVVHVFAMNTTTLAVRVVVHYDAVVVQLILVVHHMILFRQIVSSKASHNRILQREKTNLYYSIRGNKTIFRDLLTFHGRINHKQ